MPKQSSSKYKSKIFNPPTIGQPIKNDPPTSKQPIKNDQQVQEGFGIGVGIAIGQNIVNNNKNMLSSSKSLTEYDNCMKHSSNDKEKCKKFIKI